MEDVADVIADLQEGRLRTTHQLDALRDEFTELLRTDQILRRTFPSEIASTIKHFDALYAGLPADTQQRYAEIKKRRLDCRRAASAAHRLHHRCSRRRVTETGMTWSGLGGIVGLELTAAVSEEPPSFNRIDRLASSLLLDCLYRGYNLEYLTTLFERYLPQEASLRPGLIHVFRRLNSLLRHHYEVFFVVRGASTITVESTGTTVRSDDPERLKTLHIDAAKLDRFLDQLGSGPSMVVAVTCNQQPDAGAASEAARAQLQELLDYWDFESPTQKFELNPLALVTWMDKDRGTQSLLSPSESGDKRPRDQYEVEIDPEWSAQLKGLSEALRWSSVARRERTPEVALLAAWFAFEFLAGNTEKTAVEGMMEYFPKTLAIGNLRRRLYYWWKSLRGSPGFDTNPRSRHLEDFVNARSGGSPLAAMAQLLIGTLASAPSQDCAAILEIAKGSVLLRERTTAEAKLFSNSQLIAQTLQEDAKEVQRELQRFLMIRNKLVHRARIEHPLLVVVAERAKNRLYDLLRDLSAQLTKHRLEGTVGAVLSDYRDTFDELLADLGSVPSPPADFVNRVLLS